MKNFSELFKRSVALVLALMMMLSSANLGAVVQVFAAETASTSITLGQLIVDNYDESKLNEKEREIISSGLLKDDQSYSYILPPAEVKEGGLITVDERAQSVTVTAYTDAENNLWVPVSFVLKNGEDTVEGPLTLAKSGDVYVGAYEYTGNEFSVVVTYELNLTIDAAAQQKLLDASYALAQDIAVLKYLNAVSVFDAADAGLKDKLASLVGSSMNLDAVNAKFLLDTVLVTTLSQLDDQSVMDMIYQLVDGIQFDFPQYQNGEFSVVKETIKFDKDGYFPEIPEAATNLYNQVEDKGFALASVLNANSSASYLELLMIHGEALKEALNSNYADINLLATDSMGLTDIITQLTILERRLASVESQAKKTLNEKLGELNSMVDELNGYVAEINANEYYTGEKIDTYTGGKIETADDIAGLLTYVTYLKGVVETAQGEVAVALADGEKLLKQAKDGIAEVNNAMAAIESEAAALGITVKINTIDDYDGLIANAEKSRNDTLSNATAKINEKLGEPVMPPLVTQTFGQILGIEKVETAEDLKGFVDAVNAKKADPTYGSLIEGQFGEELAGAQGKLDQLAKVDDAIAKLKANREDVKAALELRATAQEKLPELEKALEDGKAMQTKLNDAHTMLVEAEAKLPEAESLLRQAEDGFADIDAAKNTLAELKTNLQMLIDLLEAFCATVKPVYDAFAANSWNTPKVVVASAAAEDYKRLNNWANGLGKNSAAVVNPLFVTKSDVKYNMSMYNVTVEYKAEIIDPAQVNSQEKIELTPYTVTVTLKKNTTAEDILKEIAGKVTESDVLKNWNIEAENFDRSTSDLPATLTSDITYTISYTPKMLTVTYGDGFDGKAPEKLPYGYNMTLTEHEDKALEYVYTVGTEDNIDQGTVVTLLEDVTISRKEGAASEKKYVTDLIIQTNSIADEDGHLIAILKSPALKKGSAISIRVPTEENVSVERANNVTTITAEEVISRVGDLLWAAKKATFEDSSVDFSGTVATTSVSPAMVDVYYELALTAAELGITEAELLAVMNTPYVLYNSYSNQKTRLDGLYAQLSNLKRLNDVDKPSDKINNTLRGALINIDSVDAAMGLGLSEAAKQAAKDLGNLIPAGSGYIALVAPLEQYAGTNMTYYYQNEALFLPQIAELNRILGILMNDDGFNALLATLGTTERDMFEDMADNMKAAAELKDYPVRSDLISITSDYLSDLLASISKAEYAKQYSQAPDEMIWTEIVQKQGAGFHKFMYALHINGKTYNSAEISVPDGDTLPAATLKAEIEKLIPDDVKDILHHYDTSHAYKDLTVEGNQTYEVTYTLKQYPVYVDGVEAPIDTLTYNDQTITLPAHENADFKYTYTINNDKVEVKQENVDYTLKPGSLDALLKDGKITISREEINLAEQLKKDREQKLIDMVDGMKGAAILTKDANEQYAIVLQVNAANLTDSMTNFAIGLATGTMLGDYKTVKLDGNTFYGENQFHLQTLIDTIMISGLGTKTITDMVDDQGNVQHMTVPGTVIGAHNFENGLGGQLLKSKMDLIAAEYTMPVDFYITLAGNQEGLLNLRNQVASLTQYISLVCKDGKAQMTVDLPEVVYEAYLAALMMVGEIDIHNFNEVNGYIVMSYVLDMLDPVLNTESGATIETLENTLAKFGAVRDLSAYEDIYNKFVTYYKGKTVDANGVCTLPLNNISINSFIDKMQETVNGMDLPAGMSINLSNLIAEYQNEGESETEAGLSLSLAAEVKDANNKYAAIFADTDGEGITNKVGLLTKEELAGKTEGATVVVLLDNYEGDLNFAATTLLDLNGKTLTGNITAAGKLVIVDSANYAAAPGKVTGTVSGENAIILGGSYGSDVTANLKPGYVQENGVVSNKLYTITKNGNDVTITLNATVADVKELASKTGVTCLAVEMLMDVAINYYNTVGLTIAGKTLYNVKLEDLIGLYAGTNRKDGLVDRALACFSASDLGELVDVLVADLTNFAALKTALEGDGKVASYAAETKAWQLKLYKAEDDYVTMDIAADETAKAGSLSLVIKGDLTGEMAQLAGALADTTVITSDVTLEDVVRNANDEIVVAGTYEGSVTVDFAKDPNYAIMMAVILADGSNAELKAKLVAAIESFYDETPVLADLEAVFNGLTVNNVCTALKNVSRNVPFTTVLNRIGLKDETIDKINVGDSEMGFNLVIELMGMALRRLDITGGTRTLGGLLKTVNDSESDHDGENYYGFDWDKDFAGSRNLVASYGLNYDISVKSVDVKVFLFAKHVHILTEVKAVEETCTEPGNKLHYVCTCGNLYEDKDAKVLIENAEDVVIPAHTRTEVKHVEATCTEPGNILYYVCSCGKLYKDADAKVLIENAEDVVIPAHTRTEVKEVPATCVSAGTKAHYKCSCGELYWDAAAKEPVAKAEDLVIPALTHNYQVTAKWAADGTCKVTEKCVSGCGYAETISATVTSKVTKPATDEKAGTIEYTAKATFEDRIYTFSKTEDLKKVAAPVHDATIAGAKVKTVEGVKYLFVDLDPVNGKTLTQLSESLIFEDLASYTVTMTIEDNDGDDRVKTADKMVVTATNEKDEVVALISYTLIVLGDVNCDGLALSNDAQAMMTIYFGNPDVTIEQELAADMNQDAAIHAADAQRTMSKYFTWGKTEGGYKTALQ